MATNEEFLLGKLSPNFHVFNVARGRLDLENKSQKSKQQYKDNILGDFFPGVDDISLIYDLEQAKIYSKLQYKSINIEIEGSNQENIAKSQYKNEVSHGQTTKYETAGTGGLAPNNFESTGYFALQDNYLYRLNNFEQCSVIDIFNIEFCESNSFKVDSNSQYQTPASYFSFQISKCEGKYGLQFGTQELLDYKAWQQAIYCYIVGTTIHSFYQLEDLLGQGSFGIVYLARPCNDNVRALGNLPPNAKVAIKQINKHKIRSSGQGLQAVVNEIRVHWALNKCDNLLKLYQIFESASNIYLILEFQRQGSLLSTLQAQKQLTEGQIRNIMMQLLLALDFIHQKHIIHRDIKIDNILINQVDNNEEYDVRIADFGLAVFTNKDENINQKCGTPGYVAPEILRGDGSGYSYKCDIFSLGSVLFNLLTGRYLFGGNSRNEVLRHNEKCDLTTKKKYVANVSENGQSLLFQMLNCSSSQRPTAREALNHPWFSDERVLLNNLIYINDYLSKGGQQAGSLLHASVSSMNLMNTNQESKQALSQKNYDSFKVASNFFVRLRKDDIDLKDSKNRAVVDDGNMSLRMMASRNNVNNMSRIASNGNASGLGPDSGPNLAGLGGALIEEINNQNNNNTGLLQRNKGSNMDLLQPRSKTSHRSVSPFNGSVSYYNAIHSFKKNKSRVGSLHHEQKDEILNGKNIRVDKNPVPEDNLPKKSKFQKKRVIEQKKQDSDSFDSVSKKSSHKQQEDQALKQKQSSVQQDNENRKSVTQKKSTKRLQPMQGHHDEHSRSKNGDVQSRASKKSLRNSHLGNGGPHQQQEEYKNLYKEGAKTIYKRDNVDYELSNVPQLALKISQQLMHKDSAYKNTDQQQKAAANVPKNYQQQQKQTIQEEKQINILKVPAMGMDNKHEIMEESKRMQLFNKKSSSIGIDKYLPADEDEGYSQASENNLHEQRAGLERVYLSKVNNGGMALRNRPVTRGVRRFIGN